MQFEGYESEKEKQKVPSEYEHDPDLYWAIQASLQPSAENQEDGSK